MINDGINNVPDKTIAVFTSPGQEDLNFNNIIENITKPPKKRDWFDSHFYNCLPLIIGNQYGFIFKLNYGFNVLWNGGDKPSDINVTWIIPDNVKTNNMMMLSHFGHGIISLNFNAVLRTPPGINLMTINPPNYIIKNATVLTGVIESDNIRAPFTFNLRIHEPNVVTSFSANSPISAFIPIPRMFADQFELKDAKKIFKDEIINEELELYSIFENKRVQDNFNRVGSDRNYFRGQDVAGNKFKEHQLPSGELKKNI